MPTAASAQGDALCVLAALFYASYDLRLFHWGKKVTPLTLSLSRSRSLSLAHLGLGTRSALRRRRQ